MGTLYLVSTPIGNLEDISMRAVRVLREAALIAAEDTRHTRRLLTHYDIHTACIAYHEHNKLSRLDAILAALDDGDVALVSDAGTPALSDPGFELVRACIAAGFAVSPIPGPSAPIAALVASGLPTNHFCYLGFLPRRSSERRSLFASLAGLTATLVCFEAPHRLQDTLADALETLGDRQIVLAREMTKLHEEFVRLRISEAQQHFSTRRPRGEFTLVIEGSTTTAAAGEHPADEAAILERLRVLRAQGQRGSAAARTAARELGVPRSDVYQLWLALEQEEQQEEDERDDDGEDEVSG
jgi:16S rRNA (cytidine1402-2'-O)-methyltransferase